MTRELLKIGIGWVLLMGFAGAEFFTSGHTLGFLANRPVIFAFTAAQLVIILFMFMRLATAPIIAKGFAVLAAFWLTLLLGYGSMDALTRSWYPVMYYNPD